MTRQAGRSSQRRGVSSRLEIDLNNFDGFKKHDLVAPFRERYKRAAALAQQAIIKLIEDLEGLNEQYLAEHNRVAITSIEGRVKEEDSFLKKLLSSCQERARAQGMSPETLEVAFLGIKDLAGVRFSCPYFDEVVPAVNDLVRLKLAASGYGTDLREDPNYEDKDYLENGDPLGYRSYHFYVRIPTIVDIYGSVDRCLCEVQARTELQHIWADKSHDLMYKPGVGWDTPDDDLVALMKQVSHNLRLADELLVHIRRQVRSENT
jgi:ppGpp synthetase/RelA/SpoT-type nucleotidyltranferase